MSTKHFMTLLNHTKPELPILSKSVTRPCATTTVKRISRTNHDHRAINRNGPLKQLGIFIGSYATRKLTLANNNPSLMIRQFQYRAASIKSSPPGQSRKKPDTRHQQETGQPDKRLLELAAHNVEWASRNMFIRNLARQIEIREAATGFKSRIFRFMFWFALNVTSNDAFTMRPFVQFPRNQKLDNRALFQRRHIERVEREIGREAMILRRYLDTTSRINNYMPSKLRRLVRPY